MLDDGRAPAQRRLALAGEQQRERAVERRVDRLGSGQIRRGHAHATLRVQYNIVRKAIVVFAFACVCGGIATAAFGCGGQILGDGIGSDNDGTIDNDSGNTAKDSGPNGAVAIGKCPSGLPGPALIPLVENGGIPASASTLPK